MNKEEAQDYIQELEGKVQELNTQLIERPERVIESIHEVVVENSTMGGDIGALAKALADAQSKFKSIGKNAEGHGYAFSDLQQVIESTSPILSKNGLAITQMLVTKMLGKNLMSGVKTILIHEGGGYISGESYVPTVKTKMNGTTQVYGVNTSYLKRYGWLAACGVATTEKDTDGVS